MGSRFYQTGCARMLKPACGKQGAARWYTALRLHPRPGTPFRNFDSGRALLLSGDYSCKVASLRTSDGAVTTPNQPLSPMLCTQDQLPS